VVRRNWTTESVVATVAARFVLNFGLLILLEVLVYEALPLGDALFFVTLFVVLITLYDRYRPVHEFRRHTATE
jgi:hypothetical protein